MNRPRFRLLLLVASAATVHPSFIAAQGLRSQIVGAVRDPSGLAVADARVWVTSNTLFGGRAETQSEPDGSYRVIGLPPGTYELRAEAPGFTVSVRPGIAIPADTTYVVDIRLAVASLTDRVNVAAEAPLLDVRTAAATTTFDRHLLESLPTDRTLQGILNLAPGVTRDVAFGGAAQTSNAVSLDGVRLMEPYTGSQTVQVGYTWADQVQVRALGAPAEVGQFTGAIADAVVRSGSNRFSGLGEFVSAIPGWTASNTRELSRDLQRQFTSRDTIATWELSGQSGGPLLRDRLWFFTGVSANHDSYRPFGYSGRESVDERAPRWIATLDAAPAPSVRLHGLYEGDRSTTALAGLGPYTTVDAAGDARRRNHLWSSGVTWTPNAQTSVELRNGGFSGEERLDPTSPGTRDGPPGRTDVETFVSSDNINTWYVAASTVVTTSAVVERFARWSGDHQIKAGLENEYATTNQDSGYPGGTFFTDMGGVPIGVQEWEGDQERTATWRTSLFVQDRWTMGRLTLEPGMRVEMNRGSVPGLASVFTNSPVGWRLGAAWDVTSDHHTVVRVHHGRYFDPVFNFLYAFNDVTGRHETVTYDITPSGDRIETGRFSSTTSAATQASLKQPRVDQFMAAVERQVRQDVVAEVRYVHRAFRDFIGFIDPRLSDWIPAATPDPGPDGALGSEDDGGSITYYQPYPGDHALELGNVRAAYRDYDALQLVATRRLRGRWQAQGSYTWSRSAGTLPNLANSNTGWWGASPSGVGANPNFHSSRPGTIRPSFDFSEVKGLATWDAPWLGGFTVSGVYKWHNGVRWERLYAQRRPTFTYVRAEPRGTRQLPSYGTVDVRVDKQLPLGAGRRAGVYLDVFNLANTGKPLTVLMLSGPSFGQPASWLDPRIVRVGVRLRFD